MEKTEAAEKANCRSVDNFNPLITTIFQVSCILVISHMFHILLKPLGQPGPFAQLLVSINRHFYIMRSIYDVNNECSWSNVDECLVVVVVVYKAGWCCGRPDIVVPHTQC